MPVGVFPGFTSNAIWGAISGDIEDQADLWAYLGTPKVYVALLSQAGTAAPVPTVLQNTLGGTVVWTRTGTGQFKATLVNAFTADKTYLPNPNVDAQFVLDTEFQMVCGWLDTGNISYVNQSVDGTSVDGLGRGYVEIQVFP